MPDDHFISVKAVNISCVNYSRTGEHDATSDDSYSVSAVRPIDVKTLKRGARYMTEPRPSYVPDSVTRRRITVDGHASWLSDSRLHLLKWKSVRPKPFWLYSNSRDSTMYDIGPADHQKCMALDSCRSIYISPSHLASIVLELIVFRLAQDLLGVLQSRLLHFGLIDRVKAYSQV